jgi:hypothetical protein
MCGAVPPLSQTYRQGVQVTTFSQRKKLVEWEEGQFDIADV